jgi:arylformamidase
MAPDAGADWGRLSRAQRDARYNNSEAVRDSQEYMAALREASAARRAAAPEGLDVPYGPRPNNRIDVFAGRNGAPCLAFIHGGYWQRNGREMFGALADGVRAHGWTAAFPGYTLTPEATLTEIVAEIAAALEVLRTRVRGPIVLSGWSAGGHLTAMGLGSAAVHAGLAISGVFELGPIRDTYLNEKARITDEEIEQLSPLRLPVGPKELAIAYGTAELPPLVADSRALHARRAASHAPGALVPIPGANHFTALNSLREERGLLTRTLLGLV